MKGKSKRDLIAKISGITIGIVLVLGISYAVFRTSDIAEKTNRINTADFNVVIDNESDEGISLTNIFPQTDQAGVKNQAYTFSVSNYGTISAKYTLSLQIDQEATLDPSLIKYQLKEDGRVLAIENLKNKTTDSEGNTLYTLDIDVVAARDKKSHQRNYELILWLDYNATTEQASNKTFSAVARIDAEQISYNEHILSAYTYDQTSCIAGDESTCQKTICYLDNTCSSGTIINYQVNDTTERTFYVLKDQGSTMTLLDSENLLTSEWGKSNNGPSNALPALEKATSNWTYVNDQTYTLGETVFGSDNPYTGCNRYSCTSNIYTWPERTGKARMIAIQELIDLGCATSSCPSWIRGGYWTLSGSGVSGAWFIPENGGLNNSSSNNGKGVRAVVVINK